VEVLLEGGADLRAQNEEGKKAFQLASKEYEYEIAQLSSERTGEGI